MGRPIAEDVEDAELAECANEPIRIPGAIQPHGRLAVTSADGELLGWSANWTGREAAARALQAVGAQRLASLGPDGPPVPLGRIDQGPEWQEVTAHRSGKCLLVEFEPAQPPSSAPAPIYSLAHSFLPQLQKAESVTELAQLAATEIKRLTGFGRALVYRFDEQGHGEVLAEALDAGYDSYMGHRFPAADVPSQARALYVQNPVRVISDARYEPVPLVSDRPQWDPHSLDLGFASLRSVSPMHLEYMRNMGTLASMSVSIVLGGRLWGLVSCHDHAPRRLAFDSRAACEHLGRLLSLQIDALERGAEASARLELRKLTLEIVAHLADGDATLQRLVQEPLPLLRMAQADGAAVFLNGQCWTVGDTPSSEQIAALAGWIAARGDDTFATDRLGEDYPPARDWGVAAGVMALSISQLHQHLVIWFRPEQLRTLRWAGEPRKLRHGQDGRVHPRRSFSTWQELVRGQSRPWSAAELAAAAELRHALIGIVLRRAEEMAEVAGELGRVNKELEAFSYTVSHDLRAPMRHIAGYVDLVQEVDGVHLSERSQRYLGNVRQAAAYAGQLVDALLDFSRMGRTELKRTRVSTSLLVRELAQEFSRQEAGGRIEWEIEDLPALWADPFLLQVVVRNLIGNAVKYSRIRPIPRIRIGAVSRPEGDGLVISDNGIGFQQKYVAKLFAVFQRLHRAEDFEGTGIGLASVRRIVERHGGTVWGEGEVDQGASFGFVLPRAPQPTEPAHPSQN